MHNKPRTLSNGDIVYPKDARIDNQTIDYLSLQGYEQNLNDSLHFILTYQPCVHRMEGKTVRLDCGRWALRTWCELKDRKVDPKYCQNCRERKTEDINHDA